MGDRERRATRGPTTMIPFLRRSGGGRSRAVAWLCCLVPRLIAAAPEPARQDVESKALTLIEAGEDEGGIRLLEAIPLQRRSDGARRALALHYDRLGDGPRALENLCEIARPTTQDRLLLATAHRRVARAAMVRGAAEEAVRHLREVVRLAARIRVPDLDRICLELAEAHLERGDADSARDRLEEIALKAKPDLGPRELRRAHLQLARLRAEAGVLPGAFELYARYLAAGGALEGEEAARYGRLAAAYADLAPLDRSEVRVFRIWWPGDPHLPARERRIRLTPIGGRLRVEGPGWTELWWKERGILHIARGPGIVHRVPIVLPIGSDPAPIGYSIGGLSWVSRVVAWGRSVGPRGTRYHHCVQVRTDPPASAPSEILTFAPGIGLVARRLLLGERVVREEILIRREPAGAAGT